MLIAGDLPLLLPGAAGTGALLGAAGHALARACGAGAGGLLPLAACGALGALPAALLLPPAAWLGAGALGTLLLAIARLDLVTGEVHAGLAGPLALLGLAQGFATGALALAAAGAAFGYLLCRLAEAGFRAATARDGLGRGDAWVLGAAGAWTGPGGTGPTLALGAALALFAALCRDGRLAPGAALPFAPALAAGAWIAWLAGGGVAGWGVP